MHDAVNTIDSLLYEGQWQHPLTHNWIDLCITGGEPMMQQRKIMGLIAELEERYHVFFGDSGAPTVIQIETNGTRLLEPGFRKFIRDNYIDINWNISPKLFNVSGEVDKVDYANIREYQDTTQLGHLKFVVNDRDETWDELNKHVDNLRDAGVHLPVYIMPVGATYEQQSDTKTLSAIANRAIANGYHVSGRLHAILFGNGIGT
jgi:organic radical activating enzyme